MKQSTKNSRVNDNQKSYLDERFKMSQTTGIKADPLQVSREFRHGKNEDREHHFAKNECLSPQQIRSYFSRTAKKNKSLGEEEVVDDESVEEESAYNLMFICQLYGSKIILRHFYIYFNISGVESQSDRRKAPYFVEEFSPIIYM